MREPSLIVVGETAHHVSYCQMGINQHGVVERNVLQPELNLAVNVCVCFQWSIRVDCPQRSDNVRDPIL